MHNVILRTVLVFLLPVLANSARADFRATYEGKNGLSRLVFEVADDGKMRVSRGDVYGDLLFLDDQIYSVMAGPGGPDVNTLEVEVELAKRQRKNWITSGQTDSTPPPIYYVPVEEMIVGGRIGTRYNYAETKFPDSTQIVLSDDPALTPLGQAFSRYEQALGIMSANDDPQETNIYDLLSEHGALQFNDYKLTSLSFDPIDQMRFTVPAKPITLADLPPEAPEVADAPREYNPIVLQAVFQSGLLYTRMSNGDVLAWVDGGSESTKVTTPGPVLSICTLGSDMYLVTGEQTGGPIALWTGPPEKWSSVTSFEQTDSDIFVTLDCSGTEPLLFSTEAIRTTNDVRPISLNPTDTVGFGYMTTLQHGGFLYVGVNMGEWGGATLRFPIAGGTGELIKPSTTITGLEPDPVRPDCILAASGLVHFLSSGAIYRICGDSASLIYAKPYTLEPDWQFDPQKVGESSQSVSFFSIGGNGKSVWAVASDGIYQIADGAEPDFQPFPRNFQLPKNGIDWSNPEFILVQTTMNRAFSVSGASLLLVPR